ERGPSGGYRLNRDPSAITLEEVVRVFQGPLAPIACATRKHPEPCPMEVGCSLLGVCRGLRDATIDFFQRTTFADLAREAGWQPRTGRRHGNGRVLEDYLVVPACARRWYRPPDAQETLSGPKNPGR